MKAQSYQGLIKFQLMHPCSHVHLPAATCLAHIRFWLELNSFWWRKSNRAPWSIYSKSNKQDWTKIKRFRLKLCPELSQHLHVYISNELKVSWRAFVGGFFASPRSSASWMVDSIIFKPTPRCLSFSSVIFIKRHNHSKHKGGARSHCWLHNIINSWLV